MNETINRDYVKGLLKDYAPPEDIDDEQLEMYDRIARLEAPDRIILYMYAELGSQQKLADALKVSITTIRKTIKNIRDKIIENDNTDNLDCTDSGTDNGCGPVPGEH